MYTAQRVHILNKEGHVVRGIEDKRKRLKLAREHAGYRSARQAALSMGWTYPTYASHENGLRDFPQKVAERYARAFRVSPEFIMFGTSPPEWAKEFGEADLVEVEAPTRSLRLFADTDAGALRGWLCNPVGGGPQFYVTDLGNLSAQTIALSVSSNEMRAKPAVVGEREIWPGDTVLIDTEHRKVRPGDTVAVLVDGDDDVHLRKVVMRDGSKLTYMALNRDYGEFAKADVVGRVTWVIAGM